MEDILSRSVCSQELWVSIAEDFVPVATRRVKYQKKKGQHSLKEFFVQSRTPRILGEPVGMLPFMSNFQFYLESGRSLLISPSSILPHSFQSRGRLKAKQASGFYPAQKYGHPS
jgi:hypothetical protein